MACKALLLAALLGGCSRSDGADAEQAPPEAAWARYLEQVAVAERIEDPIQRCLAYPDLPGNQWVPGSAKARCPLLQKGGPRLDEIAAVLDRPDGAAELDRRYAELLDAHHRDPARREALFFAYQAFNALDPAPRVAETWLARAPDSAYAQAAMGEVLVSLASVARGDELIRDTPERDLQTMQRLLARAEPLLQSALATEPRLSIACVELMRAGKMNGDEALRDSATSHCLEVDPLSWHVRFQWQLTLDPRWHATARGVDPFAALDASVESIRPLVTDNPALGGMLARGVGMRAYLPTLQGQSSPQITEGLESASRIAPDPMFIGNAGIAAYQRGEFPQALGYLSQALRLAPDSARFAGARADARRKLGDYEGSIADARHAIELDDSVGKYHSTLGQSLTKLGRTEQAREAFHAAMQYPAQRKWAFRRWCETYIHNLMPEEALACTQGLVSETPDEPEALFMRSWVLYETGDPGADAAAAQFRAVVDRADPRQRQMLSELARLTDGLAAKRATPASE